MNKKTALQMSAAFVVGILLFAGIQAYQESQRDKELFDSRYQMTVRLVTKSSAMELTSTATITVTDKDGDIVELFTLSHPAGAMEGAAIQGISSIYMDRWQWAEHELTVESFGDEFDTFTFKVSPYAFEENDPWAIRSAIEIIYSDWASSPDFIIWVGLGH